MTNVRIIFLNRQSMTPNGQYGIVSSQCDNDFTDKYVNKEDVLCDIQKLCNEAAAALCSLPEEADRAAATAVWKTLNGIHEEISRL